MKKDLYLVLSLLLFAVFAISSCGNDDPMDDPMDDPLEEVLPEGATVMPENAQPVGDVEAGRDYLFSGNYISSGIPYSTFKSVFTDDDENVLGREGENATIGPEYTAVDHLNGQKVVVANCMSCHGSRLPNGDYKVGLGNINYDFTDDQTTLINAVRLKMTFDFGTEGPEWDAFRNFERATETVAPHIVTETVGSNPADQLFTVLAAHRDPQTLEWIDEQQYEFPNIVVPTDVPAWWTTGKKNNPLYMGVGQGNHSKLFMAAATLTLEDVAEAEEIESHFADVMAFIRSIEAPLYPYPSDEDLAAQGKLVFEASCQSCHGTYGENETYPNLYIDADVVGTDALMQQQEIGGPFLNWFNSSWFASHGESGALGVTGGYVAQPLDGIWATAPYLHNGSVPNLYTLLNSESRPSYWRRTADAEYDQDHVGNSFTEETSKVDQYTYDVTLMGYGNSGHIYGDHLSEENRMALIEYLKTL